MTKTKSIKFAVIPRGLVDYYYVRIFMDNGVSYDRFYQFTYEEREWSNALGNILNDKKYAIQHLQSEFKRIQEITKTVVEANVVEPVSIKEFGPLRMNVYEDPRNDYRKGWSNYNLF